MGVHAGRLAAKNGGFRLGQKYRLRRRAAIAHQNRLGLQAGAPPTACTPRDIESARKQPNESRRRRGRDRDGGIPVERYVESTSGFWTRLNLIETSIVATR